MRRYLPLLIAIIGLAALYVDFFPNAQVPYLTDPGVVKKAETKLGLDLVGGAQLEYQAVVAPGQKPPTADDMNTIKNIMEERVNGSGVVEPVVETQGSDRIVVQLPGNIPDFEKLRTLIGSTAQLIFVPLDRTKYGYMNNGTPVQGTEPVPSPGTDVTSLLNSGAWVPLFRGDQVDGGNVNVGRDTTSGDWTVNFKLKDQGKNAFGSWSSQNVGNYFAIVLDNKVVSTPYIREPITDGSGQISGSFTQQSAQDLVTTLKYGALPYAVKELTRTTVPATLGQSFLDQTMLAGAIGIGLVLLFMLVYYRLPGLVADVALLYYAIVVLALFRMVPVTLTLAGIAGFVLSVGMAVDANILIFERTKEELRTGKTLAAAVEAGFNRAWNSIFDSNVSSLITASILYVGGSSIIRGFALVLIVGVVTSMFTAITVSRTLLRFVISQPAARKAWLFGVTDEEFQGRSVVRRGARGEAASRV